jgi:hypothetical protein
MKKHLVKYYLIGSAIVLIAYLPTFILEPTKVVKTISNWFLLIYPLVLMYYMVINYPKNHKISYLLKVLMNMGLIIAIVSTNLVLVYTNLSNQVMSEGEKELGIVAINMGYGAMIFLGGMIVSAIAKPKHSIT